MTEFVKRFYKSAHVDNDGNGFVVRLDGATIKTPARNDLRLPHLTLAQAIADEWQAQGEKIHPVNMPMTRLANTAIDRVTYEAKAVVEQLSAYGESDLVCYRASTPESLVARQTQHWDPLVDWAGREFSAPLMVTKGVTPVVQSTAALSALRRPLETLDAFALAGFAELVTATGSLVIALALLHRQIDEGAAWQAASLDEVYQIERWGADPELESILEARQAALMAGLKFLRLAQGASDNVGS